MIPQIMHTNLGLDLRYILAAIGIDIAYIL